MNTRCSLNADKADLLEPASIQVRVAFRHRSCNTGENELEVSGSDWTEMDWEYAWRVGRTELDIPRFYEVRVMHKCIRWCAHSTDDS